MHPLVMFAISVQERAARDHENELIWRNGRAASPTAIERDRRWARAISRWAAPERDTTPDSPAQKVGCATA